MDTNRSHRIASTTSGSNCSKSRFLISLFQREIDGWNARRLSLCRGHNRHAIVSSVDSLHKGRLCVLPGFPPADDSSGTRAGCRDKDVGECRLIVGSHQAVAGRPSSNRAGRSYSDAAYRITDLRVHLISPMWQSSITAKRTLIPARARSKLCYAPPSSSRQIRRRTERSQHPRGTAIRSAQRA